MQDEARVTEAQVKEVLERWSTQEGSVSHDDISRTDAILSAIGPRDLTVVQPLVEVICERASREAEVALARGVLTGFLDRVRRRSFTTLITPELVDRWTSLVVAVIERANFTFPALLASREKTDPNVVALRELGDRECSISVAELGRRTRAIARGLLSLLEDEQHGMVALLSENSLESALCDLACLSNGIVNARVAANATASQVEYILRHAEVRLLVVSNEDQLRKVLPALPDLPKLRSVVVISGADADRHGLLSLEQMVAQGADVDDAVREARATGVGSRNLATVMYTSGTTGLPKGIMFSHLNIVSKRFCRGFALPEIGEGDVFLSFLPLYHTFGRWLELTGTLYWGATYVFARNPSRATLLEDFASVRPTVFISVPAKWMELHEQATQDAGEEDPQKVADRLKELLGGRLRYGLSAAGYLDPLVFRAVHRAGAELCSGYGMTEATGGITMTPPGGYRDGSIGVALPGVELRAAEDAELLIRGPYVMTGYFLPPDGKTGVDDQGWFATGDIVAHDDEGHYRIVDRKKEIYKNRKGQTIAPQRVENLFRDFEVVAQAFLVGDHREYNTLLFYPNFEGQPELRDKSSAELRDLLGSLVVSANRFLAPFERVVAFQILPRALAEEHGELTPKGTFKRQVVEEKWSELIEPMYEARDVVVRVDDLDVRVPNWLLREMGVLHGNVSWEQGVLHALDREVDLRMEGNGDRLLRIGDFRYSTHAAVLDLSALLNQPALWLGNEGLRAFLGDETLASIVSRRRAPTQQLELHPGKVPVPPLARVRELLGSVESDEVSPSSMHAAALLLPLGSTEGSTAVRHLEHGTELGRSQLSDLCRALLRRMAEYGPVDIRRLALRVLIATELDAELISTMRSFVGPDPSAVLWDDDLDALSERGLPDRQIQVLVRFLSDYARVGEESGSESSDIPLVVGVVRLLAAYAVAHPAWYARVRFPLARLTLHSDEVIAARAGEELDRVQLGFRARIGPNMRLAVDPDSGHEYGWRDVVVFDEEVDSKHHDVLVRAITNTSLVRESVFLFGKGVLLNLADIPPKSLWVSHLGTNHGKSVFRLSVQTRARGSFDIALNLAETVPVSEIREEIRWLMSAGAEPPLVEVFGAYYAEYGIFTEEFIPGETGDRQVARLFRQGAVDRLKALWPFLVWNALGAQIDFWDRSGRRLALSQPSPSNVIIPSHDYHVGARLVSISDRSECTTLDELLARFQRSFVEHVEGQFPDLKGLISPVILLSAFIETLGVERGAAALEKAGDGERGQVIRGFLEALASRGYTPMRLYFAAQRYARWIAVNPNATVEARGDMVHQLWETYRLGDEERVHSDTRIRFFRQTVFKEAREPVVRELEQLMSAARDAKVPSEMSEQLAVVRGSVKPNVEEDYFLARLTFRHLRPSDDAALISLPSGTTRTVDVVVTMHDAEGARFGVRGPVSPRETARLLALFHQANFPVTFTGEHEYLLAVDENDQVIGGLFYRTLTDDRAYLEKIVVARRHRKKGISDGLLNEAMRRLRSRGVTSLETGFFRPEYLLRFGFHTEPNFSGLVRDLTDVPASKNATPETVG